MAAGILTTSALVVNSAMFATAPDLLARAVSLDVAVVLPGLYWLLARRRGWRQVTVIPIFLLSLVAAHAVLPPDHTGFLQLIELLAVPVELFAIGYLIHKARRIGREYGTARASTRDFLEALEHVLSRGGVHPRVVQVGVTEASVIHYGLLGWRQRHRPRPGTDSFTYHVRMGYGVLVGAFILLILLETTLLHLVLAPRIEVLAWVLAFLSVYGVVFLVADFHAARLRPVLVDDRFLHLRTSFRWRSSIRMEDILDVEVSSQEIEDKRRTLRAVLIGDHNVIVRLRQPYTAKGLYGLAKRFDVIALAVDDARGFAEAIRRRSSG